MSTEPNASVLQYLNGVWCSVVSLSVLDESHGGAFLLPMFSSADFTPPREEWAFVFFQPAPVTFAVWIHGFFYPTSFGLRMTLARLGFSYVFFFVELSQRLAVLDFRCRSLGR
jgi:hypothetical protein